MSQLVEVRNPQDLTNTYDTIEIQGGAAADGSGMANLTTALAIDTTTANDLTTGFSTYTDTADSAYYRFRYKNALSGVLSSYSDVFAANTTVMHARFRRRMRDTNSNNYYFTNDDITMLLGNAIKKLFPHTYNEVIDESLATSNTTRKYSFPVGVNRINDIEFLDSQGDVQQLPRNYKLRARQIIFDSPPPSGYTMRLYCDKMFKKLAEIPDFLDDLILDLMVLEAYEHFEAERQQFYKYTTVTNPEGGNLPSVARVIERLETTTVRRLNALRRVRRAGIIKLV